MGYRTIIALNNDRSSDWNYDPELGQKIMRIAVFGEDRASESERIGLTLVECNHSDTQSLIVADGYTAKAVGFGHWHRGQTEEQRNLELLKDLADRLGYRVAKKPAL